MAQNGTKLLLLIDDEPAQCRLISALASRAGFRTIVARDAETAIATLGTQDGMMLDAIILDHWVPGSEATDLIAELKSRRPALPVLMLTAVGSISEAVEAVRAGATDYLIKPVAPELMLQALNAAVESSKDTGELRPLSEKQIKYALADVTHSGIDRRRRRGWQGSDRRRHSCRKPAVKIADVEAELWCNYRKSPRFDPFRS